MIVTMANAKGGVAKTTGAILLAVAWARRFEREAVVLDADPQSSASLWRDMAEDAGSSAGLVDVRPANLSTLRRAGRLGADGLVVVDAPQGRLLEEAMKVADFVIVPTSDSPLDLQQAWATMAAIPSGLKGGGAGVARRGEHARVCGHDRGIRPGGHAPVRHGGQEASGDQEDDGQPARLVV